MKLQSWDVVILHIAIAIPMSLAFGNADSNCVSIMALRYQRAIIFHNFTNCYIYTAYIYTIDANKKEKEKEHGWRIPAVKGN